MTAIEQRARSLVTQQAADWFIANRGGLNSRERTNFIAWLKASPLHVEEYLALSVIARDLREASEDSRGEIEALLARARLEEVSNVEPFWPRLASAVADLAAGRRWQRAVTVSAIAVAALGVVLMGTRMSMLRPAAPGRVTVLSFHTRHGVMETEHLPDDSVLHLNTDSAVTVRFSKRERLVELTAGEADFEVKRDPARSFRVLAGAAAVADLGTRFDVRLEHGSTVVTVVEGHVDVGLSRPSPTVHLTANQQVTVADGDWPVAPVVVDAQRSTAWLHRQITFEHEPLERVAREFNRYSRTPIEITTPALRNLEISGVFSTDDTDAFIAFLKSLDGVHVDVTPSRIRVSQK